MNHTLRKTIYKLETALLQPSVRKSREKLYDLLSDDFREFGSSGSIGNKKQVLKELPTSSPAKFALSNFVIKELSRDIVLATYRVSKKSIGKKRAVYSLRSSIWKKTGGHWQMIFHQGTLEVN